MVYKFNVFFNLCQYHKEVMKMPLIFQMFIQELVFFS